MIPMSHLSFVQCEQIKLRPKKNVRMKVSHSVVAVGKGGSAGRGGWCWVNFQCRDVLLIWIIIGQGPIALAVGAGGVVWTFLSSPIFSLFFLPLSETARYRLKYVSKGR